MGCRHDLQSVNPLKLVLTINQFQSPCLQAQVCVQVTYYGQFGIKTKHNHMLTCYSMQHNTGAHMDL